MLVVRKEEWRSKDSDICAWRSFGGEVFGASEGAGPSRRHNRDVHHSDWFPGSKLDGD
jgi:hypothetical protein